MPILRTDIFDSGFDVITHAVGRRWFPANAEQMERVNQRWCNQCKRLFDCDIKAKVDMTVGLHNNDFHSIIAESLVGAVSDGVDLRPAEWRVDFNGQPKCSAMEVM